MRNQIRYGTVLAVISLFVAACGEDPASQQPEARGGLKVAAKSLVDLEDVESVTVRLASEGADYELSLERGTDGVWRGERKHLYVGSYAVTAEAKDAGGEVLFSAAPDQEVTISKNATTAVTIFLNEVMDPGEVEFPRFVMITLDKAVVEQWERLTISVEVEGGAAPYSLSGENAVLNVPEWNPPGSFHDEQMSGNTGSIEWEPPLHAGPKWFKVRVTDAAGNIAEVGIDVTVGSDIGDAEVEVDFIMAPVTTVAGRVLNDNEGTTAYLWVLPGGPGATGPMTYAWGHGDCNGTFLTGAETGTFTPPAPADGWYFRYQIGRGDASGVCTLTLTTVGSHGAAYVNEVLIDTEWVQPTVPNP